MPVIKNKSPGARVFNLKTTQPAVILQHTLQPGESADLDLLLPIDQDPSLQAMIKAGELEEVGADALKFEQADLQKVVEAEAKAAEAVAEATRLREELPALEVDAARRTPPRQQGSDGGPQQVPTIDGSGGALTASQEESGRVELPRAEADKAAAERAAQAGKAAEAEKAKAEPAKPAHRGR